MGARLSGLLGADRRLKIDLTPMNPQFGSGKLNVSNDFPVLIHGPPAAVLLAIDIDEDLID
ncbi:MAG: hypothetical protein ACI9GB_002629 [Halioglobus sp.]|jgi:hypothetical protein